MILGLVMVVSTSFFDSTGPLHPFKVANEEGRLKLFDFSPNLYRNDVFLTVFCGTLINWCGCYCISQTEVQRFCSTKSAKHAKKTLYWNLPPVVGIALLAIWCGIVVFAKYFQCDPVSMGIIKRNDQLMPYFVMETMASVPGVAGEYNLPHNLFTEF
jgi:Na+/proline symporter